MKRSFYLLICALLISFLIQGQSNLQNGISFYQAKKLMRLGQIKEKQGNKTEAKKYYETALKLNGKLEGAQKGLERVSK